MTHYEMRRHSRCARIARDYFSKKKNVASGAMIVWQIIGWSALVAGPAVRVRDVIAEFDSKVWAPLALGQLWYAVDRSSLDLARALTQRYVLAVFFGDRVIVQVLLCWACAALIGLGSDPAARVKTPAMAFLIGTGEEPVV
jgi:hypothetical protein